MKRALDSLAIFGGDRLFATPRPIGQLAVPEVEAYLALVRQAFERRWLANGGPIVQQLEERLADFHDVGHAVALANAGLGLIMLLQIFSRGRQGEVIMPAFSYRGLPHFARWAGQEPRFCEVAAASHALDPAAVADAVCERTTAILAVCNAHSPGDIDGLCRVAGEHSVPILFDSVYAQGATYHRRRLGGFGAAEVYSLHATKLMNGFEGGYVTTNDDDLAAKLRWQRNFCLPGLAPAGIDGAENILGVNAKLNELHAAMAVLSLDGLPDTIDRNAERLAAYETALEPIAGLQVLAPPEGPVEARNHSLIVAEIGEGWSLSREATLALLRAEGAVIAPYYSPPLHLSQHASAHATPPALPVTERLARRFIQLPCGDLVTVADIAAIGQLLEFCAAHGAAIAARMASGASA